ncbi:unnamed protein product [Ectocarpus sp. 6 AP-2014]
MNTAFQKAGFLQSIPLFKRCLRIGFDHSKQDFFNRTPIFGLRLCRDASVKEFVDVLRAFKAAGADIDHVDMFGNTLLLMTEVDNLGVALVKVGARISYDWQNYSKRALANAAIYGCPRTIDAMVLSRVHQPNRFRQEDFDSCFDQAAKTVAYNPVFDDMTGIVKLVVDYGADPNRWNTLHYGVRHNHVLVSTLVSLGANTDNLAWDCNREVYNTPLHRIADMMTVDVLDAIVTPSTDLDITDGAGRSPLMSLMRTSPTLLSANSIMMRFIWLVERGASCLPKDNGGKRVSDMPRSNNWPFKQMIAARIRDENWNKRRHLVLMREILSSHTRLRRSRRNAQQLLHKVADMRADGVFRHIVTFL